MNEVWYLCYDVRGIQQFIYSVPKLKYVVGGSLLVSQFDQRAKNCGVGDCVFTGGGRGMFSCSSKQCAEQLRHQLIPLAHEVGLDLRIGIRENPSDAARYADDLYPFLPDLNPGEPCAASGFWPVDPEDQKTPGIPSYLRDVHPVIRKRIEAVKEAQEQTRELQEQRRTHDGTVPFNLENGTAKYPEQWIFQELMERNRDRAKPLHELLFCSGEVQFLSSVHADEEEDEAFRSLANKADVALGSRNRWAILSMDGNDMGAQFREFQRHNDTTTSEGQNRLHQWLRIMSDELDRCTKQAFLVGLETVLEEWWRDEGHSLLESERHRSPVILPFRPLIIGGDDVLCICHASYAMKLAEEIIRQFEKHSRSAADRAAKDQHKDPHFSLWPATNGCLTISAGIVYAKVTLPLFNAIPYAESLLGGAKKKFRQKTREGEKPLKPGPPTSAAIDWESITETMLDTPTARRKREMYFYDQDLGVDIFLYGRPYKATEITYLREQAQMLGHAGQVSVPRSVLAEVMTVLQLPWAKRAQRFAALRKRQPHLVDKVQDFTTEDSSGDRGEFWRRNSDGTKRSWTCIFADILSLMEEEIRMEQNTIQQKP